MTRNASAPPEPPARSLTGTVRRLRRRSPCIVEIDDRTEIDFAAFFRGEMRWIPHPGVWFLCPLSGERIELSAAELGLLAEVPAQDGVEWDELLRAGHPAGRIERLVSAGLLLDPDSTDGRRREQRERRLREIGWEPLAAVYSAHSQWSDVFSDTASREHGEAAEAERLASLVQRFGPPPAHFVHRTDAIADVPLSLPPLDPWLEMLQRRQTVRSFRTGEWLGRAAFERMIYGTLGFFGHRPLPSGAVAMKRTSASGGGLHPVEGYLLVAKVEGITPGLYHYRGETHSLSLLQAQDEARVRERITRYTGGQEYFSEAHAAIIYVVRFHRHYWKYAGHKKAYKAMLMDVAHLSQTAYTLATSDDLGAYFTAAINDGMIGGELGLDPIEQAAVAISGFGLRDDGRTGLRFNHLPFDPVARRSSDPSPSHPE